MEHIQYSYPEEVSVTFTCEKIFPPQPNIKSLKIHNNIIPANLACYMVYAISCTSQDNTRAVFLKTLATCAKILHLSII